MTRPLGIYEKALPMQGSWIERLSIAAQAGFDFIEISIDESERLARLDWSSQDIRKLQDAVLETGVQVYAIILSALRTYPLGSVVQETRDKARVILHQAIDLAARVGIKVVQVPGYFRFYEPAHTQAEHYFLEGLQQGAIWASQVGVMLGLENMDGDDVLSLATARCLIRHINSPWLKLYPDIGNLAANGLDVCQELEQAEGCIIGVHLKDTRLGEYRRVPYGEGIVPFTDAFKTLGTMNYTGGFLIEMWNDDAANAVQIVSDAKRWIYARMQEAGLS
ncbi:MAG: L-ribulose-5-phosphate 3-epimerase [Deinococcota bacterium]